MSSFIVCSSKNMTKPRPVEMNPPDLWIHGNVADVADKMSDDDDRASTVRSSSHTTHSYRTGLSAALSCVCTGKMCLCQMPVYAGCYGILLIDLFWSELICQNKGKTRAVLSQGGPRDAAVNFGTYRSLYSGIAQFLLR